MLPALVIPICIGMMLYIGMLALIQHDIITNETVLRYLTGHPVSKITLAMFFVGCASLLMIGTNVFEQFGAAKKIQLDTPVENSDGNESLESDIKSNQEVDRAVGYAKSMLQLPRWMHDHYLWQRIVNALHSVYRTGAATGVEDELKYLAELDFDRQQQRYSLVRILIWATPMLGFLGTVLGISQALGGINVGPENDFQQMMDGLRGSLYVAFDTTALALTLSMILMFGQFLVDRFESQLLSLVDQRARGAIAGKFNLSLSQPEISLEKISGEVVDAMKQAVDAQTEVWRKTIRSAEQAWASSLSDVGGVVQEQLSVAIDESVAELGRYLGNSIEKADASMAHRWEQWQVTLSDNARLLAEHQSQLVDQTTLIKNLLVQTDEMSLFEPAISKNLSAINETNRLRESLNELAKVVGGLAEQTTGDSEQTDLSVSNEPSSNGEATNDLSSTDYGPEIILPFPSNQQDRMMETAPAGVEFLPDVIISLPNKAA